MTDTVKMPEPVIRDMEPYCEPTGFTKAQMKQYGDDREREALEKAAKVCDAKADRVNSTWIPHECASQIRALAKEIK